MGDLVVTPRVIIPDDELRACKFFQVRIDTARGV